MASCLVFVHIINAPLSAHYVQNYLKIITALRNIQTHISNAPYIIYAQVGFVKIKHFLTLFDEVSKCSMAALLVFLYIIRAPLSHLTIDEWIQVKDKSPKNISNI